MNNRESYSIIRRQVLLKRMTYYTDCFVFGKNPSSVGGGFTITDEAGNVIYREEVYKPAFTSNEGELLGVLFAIQLANRGDTIITDSKNTLAWVRSGKPKARPDLTDKCLMAKNLLALKNLTIAWKPRDENKAGIINEFGRLF